MTRFPRYPHRADLAGDYREACATEGHDLGESRPDAPGFTGVCRRCDVNVEDEAFPCGHESTVPGCGGCDPGAVAYVLDDTGRVVWRAGDEVAS